MKLFYYIFAIFMIIVIFLAVIGYLPIVKFVRSNIQPQDKKLLPFHTAEFIDRNIIDLKHIN